MKGDPAKIIAQFAALVDRAVATAKPPDLIVWPETAYPYGYIAIDPAVDRATLERQVRSISAKITRRRHGSRSRKLIADELHLWADQTKVPMLVGSTFYDHQPGCAREIQLGDPAFSPIVAADRLITTRCIWSRSASTSRSSTSCRGCRF